MDSRFSFEGKGSLLGRTGGGRLTIYSKRDMYSCHSFLADAPQSVHGDCSGRSDPSVEAEGREVDTHVMYSLKFKNLTSSILNKFNLTYV